MLLPTFKFSIPIGIPTISKMLRLVIVGVLVHLLLLSAVFDIYFVSPVHHGMTPHKAKSVPLAKRVVLFVADGLRVDSLYHEDMGKRAPFLKTMKDGASSWGISHTQVPTESRPGHIAMLAGFNEDPSAITRGWKYNPVDFDSVINQSTNAFCWGSPDIVDMFNRDNLSHIHLDSYDPYMQDFSGLKEPTDLDGWVFDRVTDFLLDQTKENCTDVCEQGNIFFLHLLGLDTAGHSFKPQSITYNATLKYTDQGIGKMVKMFEAFFNDNKTAYIFTADHGMTNWGSHGDGSPHETEVPIIAWGSGVAARNISEDLEQLNIAALISALIGINFPINSLGVVSVEYLNASLAQTANIMLANMLQLSEQYLAKHLSMQANTMSWLFQPFSKINEKDLILLKNRLDTLLITKEYKRVISECFDAIDTIKTGLKYYYKYYQTLLLTFVTIGFVGWIIYLFISIKDLNTIEYDRCKRHLEKYTENWCNVHPAVVALILVCCCAPFATSVPANYYMYILFPIFTWCMVLSNYKNGMLSFALLSTFNKRDLIVTITTYIYQLELLLLTFFHNVYLTMLLLNLGYLEALKKYHRFSLWVIGLFILSVCPLLTTLQTVFSATSQVLALLMWMCYGYLLHIRLPYSKDKRILQVQFYLLYGTFINTLCVEFFEAYNIGGIAYSQSWSWSILASSWVYPFLMSTNLQMRVISCFIALLMPYTLMAVGHESIFIFFFVHQMLRWLRAEHKLKCSSYPQTKPLRLYSSSNITHEGHTDSHSVKLCFTLLIFIMLSFFGTGNSASISSFDPMWTRCFLTVFSPFTMSALILIKLTIPFLIVMCAFRGIMIISEAQIQNTFLIILLFCDAMVLQFLYLVKNEGSWLEIGMSLSRFIVVIVTTIVLLLLYQVALFMTSKTLSQFLLKVFLVLGIVEREPPEEYGQGDHAHIHVLLL